MRIRAYSTSDREQVIELWGQVFPDEPEWNGSAALIETKLATQPEMFLVCEVEGRIAGTAVAGFDGVRGWVHKVASHPIHRRQGIASRLMEEVERRLAEMGCPKLNLQVRAGNEAAVAFYRDRGYLIEDRVSLGKRLGN